MIIQPKVDELIQPLLPSALELLDRLLPESPLAELAIPIEDARVICGIDERKAA